MPLLGNSLNTSSPSAPGRCLEFGQQFTARVLAQQNEATRLLNGRAIKFVGKRLIAEFSADLPSGAAVWIDSDRAILLGEVVGSWRKGRITFGAVELREQLKTS